MFNNPTILTMWTPESIRTLVVRTFSSSLVADGVVFTVAGKLTLITKLPVKTDN